MKRFLVIHPMPDPPGVRGWRDELARLARRAHDAGLHPIETFYTAERGLAYTLYEAPDAGSIRKLHERVGLAAPHDVLSAERVYPELLAEPRRDR
jgi:hypothetical protein